MLRSISDVKSRMDDLSVRKQDVASAVSKDDVGMAATRAIDHADRKIGNISMSLAGELLLPFGG